MVDVVDVLDAFGAKRARKPIFEVEQGRIGDGYFVRATLSDGTVDRIEGFATEGKPDAQSKANRRYGFMNGASERDSC